MAWYNRSKARRKPPDPREGFNPTSLLTLVNQPHVLRAACLRIQANSWRTRSWIKNLPARPNLDHLRRQAKALLAALESGDAGSRFDHSEPSPVRQRHDGRASAWQSRFRLADAQSAIARKSGFASWPHLARHVEQLRALEGTWAFARLEIDGGAIPATALGASRMLIDGDRFRTESPEANLRRHLQHQCRSPAA